MTAGLPSVSVVIPVRDSAATIEGAVSAALAQDYPGGVDVVIAEGRSRDDSRAIIERIASREDRVSVVDNPSGETPAALNAAILGSSGDVIVRCDAHAQLPDGYVTAAVSRLHATGAGVVGGVQDAVGQTAFERAVAYAMANPMGSGGAAYRSAGAAGVVETVYLGVFPRTVLAEVGLFDESLQRSQDYELNHRIAAAGHDVFFAPELQVRYRPRGSVGSLWRQYFAYGQWKRHVVRRNPGSLRLRQLAAPALVAGLVMSAAIAFSPWTWAGVAVPLVYAAAVLSVTGFEIVRRGDVAAGLIVVVLPTMHLAWGSGFWRGGTRAGEQRIRRIDA